MNGQKNYLSEFRTDKHLEFYEKIKRSGIVDDDQAEAIGYALYDISESIEKIYTQIIPEIMNENLSKTSIEDLFWDLKTEFEHIQYHMNDADFVLYKDIGLE